MTRRKIILDLPLATASIVLWGGTGCAKPSNIIPSGPDLDRLRRADRPSEGVGTIETAWGRMAWLDANVTRGVRATVPNERFVTRESDPEGRSGAWLRHSASPLPLEWIDPPGRIDVATLLDQTLAAIAATGGGTARAARGAIYRMRRGIIIAAGVTLDLNGATLRLELPAGSDIVGCQLRDRAALINGTVEVTAEGGPRGMNLVHHCCIIVGESGGPPRGYRGWRLAALTLRNNRDDDVGGTGIVVYSGSNNGIIEDITFPGSATLGAAIRVHWASYTAPGDDAPTQSAHPHDIVIRRVMIGRMTKPAVSGPGRISADVAAIDIAGAHDVVVEDVVARAWGGDAFCQVRAGAYGSVAADRRGKERFLQGITLRRLRCDRTANEGFLVNGRAHGGADVATHSYPLPVRILDCRATGAGADAKPGRAAFKTMFASGVRLERCEGSGNDRGLFVDEASSDITDVEGVYSDNLREGVCVANAAQPPTGVLLDRTTSRDNGRSGEGACGFYFESCSNIYMKECISGSRDEVHQFYGIFIGPDVRNIRYSMRFVHTMPGGKDLHSYSVKD